MSEARLSLPVVRGFGETSRRDRWWIQPLAVVLGLSAFLIYSTARALQGNYYFYGPYLSPMYSPLLFHDPLVKGYGSTQHHGWFGPAPAWLLALPLFTPAFLILWGPDGFRFTCYYYRGAYYKAFWADPPSCAVGEPRKSYWGEHSLPLILQNVHRYFLYVALFFLVVLSWDVYKALWFHDKVTGEVSFGVGIGTLVLALNVVLLGGYTLGCHSLRHLIGGRIDQLSKAPLQQKAHDCVSCLNRRHMLFAWCSLFWVGFTDFYVFMCSIEVWHDWNTVTGWK
jgi:hypothetical protein